MADSGRPMVRRSFSITAAQAVALKWLAAERGITEAEVIRQALQRFIEREGSNRIPSDQGADALEVLFAEWDAIPWSAPPTGLERFGVYEDRG
jgi:hypothetical protein